MDSSEVIFGRPFGGCSFLIRKSLLHYVTRLKSNSSRFCAISIDTGSFITLLMCVYLPTNYGTSIADNLFLETLSEIKGFVDSVTFNNLIIAGNFNVDLDRSSSH